MLKRNLLVLLALATVAPVSAHQRPAATHKSPACPYERARAEAAAAAAVHAAPVKKAPTTITLTDRVPRESSLWAMSQGSGVLNP